MGRFFIFIIIVSIALVLGMAFLVTHFWSARILLRCAVRTTAEGRFAFPSVSPRAEHPQAALSTAGWRRRGGAIWVHEAFQLCPLAGDEQRSRGAIHSSHLQFGDLAPKFGQFESQSVDQSEQTANI
jgi:hypothetical protein